MMVKRARGSLLLSIKFDRNSHQPISTQLYVAMRELILAGGFLAGERLPATRILAKDLGISRTTVIEVFDRLTSESLVTSKTGAGTYVSKALSAERPKPVAQHTAQQDQRAPQLSKLMGQAFLRFSDRKRLPHAPRAFTTALPAFDFFPMAQWARLSAKYIRGSREDVMGYGDPNGAAQLRRAIASHLRVNRGISCAVSYTHLTLPTNVP
jgi:GntR family transcriptional regulator/MocR family aminotransferase